MSLKLVEMFNDIYGKGSGITSSWRLTDKLRKIVSQNIKEIPYEGTEVSSENIVSATEELLQGILKGYGTHILQNYEITDKGWKEKSTGKISPKSEIIYNFLQHKLK